MSCEGKIYVGQLGVSIEADTQGTDPDCPVVNWSDATTLEIILRLPDKTEVKLPATLDGSLLKYLTDDVADLPQSGKYLVQAHVVGPGYDALGETASFKVYDKWR